MHAGSETVTSEKERLTSDQTPGQATNTRAREAALAAISRLGRRPTPLVAYQSAGRVLVIGPGAEASAAARSLGSELRCFLVVTDETVPASPASLQAQPASLSGHLGEFRLSLQAGEQTVDLGQVAGEGYS